ncbi:MAG: nucleotidyltransferase family protein [Bacteroidaceae bacterium]|nr:nucleotidyltransferase family protein [Bacteroidaceae bacterium]
MSKFLLDEEQTVFLRLLRAGLWEQDVEDLSVFPLSTESWRKIFVMSAEQTVVGIVYRGLHHIPGDCLPPLNLMCRWVAEIDCIERNNRQMNHVLAELIDLFDKHGIWAVLQKGQGVARMYEHPLLRECGDIDLYFPEKTDFNLACRLIRQYNVDVEKASDKARLYCWNGINVEHHLSLFDIHSPFLRSYLSDLTEKAGFVGTCISSEDDSMSVTVPSPLLTLLMLSTHILKHTLGLGIGLRQLCDMARACHCLHDSVDGEELKYVFRRIGLYKWNNLLLWFLTEHLGLALSDLPYGCIPDRNADRLLGMVLDRGNFGIRVRKCTGAEEAAWKHKLNTSGSFFRNGVFSAQYAASESFWIFSKLLLGQLR